MGVMNERTKLGIMVACGVLCVVVAVLIVYYANYAGIAGLSITNNQASLSSVANVTATLANGTTVIGTVPPKAMVISPAPGASSVGAVQLVITDSDFQARLAAMTTASETAINYNIPLLRASNEVRLAQETFHIRGGTTGTHYPCKAVVTLTSGKAVVSITPANYLSVGTTGAYTDGFRFEKSLQIVGELIFKKKTYTSTVDVTEDDLEGASATATTGSFWQ